VSKNVADLVFSPAAFALLTAATSSNTSSLSLATPPWRPAQTPLKPFPSPSKDVKFGNTATASLLTHLQPFPAVTRETAGMKTAAQAAPSLENRCRSLMDKLLSLLDGGHSSTTTSSSEDSGKACIVSPAGRLTTSRSALLPCTLHVFALTSVLTGNYTWVPMYAYADARLLTALVLL